MSSTQFEQERQALIQKLEEQTNFIQSVQSENNRLGLLNSKQLDDLHDIEDKNSKFLHKLKSNEFEIAIVGLEKAGKSTFANALIGNNAVPSAPERCTFTSTRLVYGADRGIVEFYTEPEFNQIFQNLLKEIDYPDAESADYKTLSLERFEDYFNNLENIDPNLYRNHVGKTDEEIKDILKYRDKLTLTGKIKEFPKEDLYSDKFQAYIKGEKRSDGVDTSKPRSVKRVEIESSKLEKLPTAIIYDVPGFDSPTKIHIRQTEERLKNADIIILVTNVGRNPSLQGTSLNIINNNTDSDGIPLKDKLFVFGNQLDTANSLEQANGNIEILAKDVEKYKIGERKRIFAGSALKYLSELGKAQDNYDGTYAIDANIDEIRDSITNYYQTERFEILKTKISNNQKMLIDLFNDVMKSFNHSDFGDDFNEQSERSIITRETYQRIESNLKSSLEELKLKLKREIYDDRFFTMQFKDDVDSLGYFFPISEDKFDDILMKEDDSVTPDIAAERINQAIRKDVHKIFLQNYSKLIHNLTNQKSKEIEYRLLKTVTDAVLDGSRISVSYEEIEEQCKNLITKITGNIAHNNDRFDYLIERFSRNLFDIMLSYPLLSNDRKDKFDKAKNEFRYLDGFYQNADGTLINLLLSQRKETILEKGKVYNALVEVIKLAEKTISHGSPLPAVLSFAKDFLNKGGNSVVTTDYQYTDVVTGVTRSKTKEAVVNEINTDIANLKDILIKAVIPAINLELAFFNGIDKQIKLLIDAQNRTNENAEILNKFLSYIVPIVKKQEFDNINQKIETHKLKLEFMEKIKSYI
ncbi:dynamin family protein [uncultured Haemophilus sp.]|uniref:dynamin family protein n=1 Tax=uncultured Haemophilus sp. TaxID=237779 RepID=UPI00258EB147|nr:dynamin family protein [uncultured Haemophilus sp.]